MIEFKRGFARQKTVGDQIDAFRMANLTTLFWTRVIFSLFSFSDNNRCESVTDLSRKRHFHVILAQFNGPAKTSASVAKLNEKKYTRIMYGVAVCFAVTV